MSSKSIEIDFESKLIENQETRHKVMLKLLFSSISTSICLPVGILSEIDISIIAVSALASICVHAYFWCEYQGYNKRIALLKELSSNTK